MTWPSVPPGERKKYSTSASGGAQSTIASTERFVFNVIVSSIRSLRMPILDDSRSLGGGIVVNSSCAREPRGQFHFSWMR